MNAELQQLLIGLLLALLFAGGAVVSSYAPNPVRFARNMMIDDTASTSTETLHTTDTTFENTNTEETASTTVTQNETITVDTEAVNTPQEREEGRIEDDPQTEQTSNPEGTVTETSSTESAAPDIVAEQNTASEEIAESPSLLNINLNARAATVNILCLSNTPNINSITGSGVIVAESGVVLTNAHIAQYLLLEDYPTEGANECVIRNGSPAAARYDAELVYLPPEWITENRESIRLALPTGTGEYDFAFLRITETIDGSMLPGTFPTLPLNTSETVIDEDAEVLIASYPADFLGGTLILNELNLVSALSRIVSIFTFNAETIDLFSTGGSIAAQRGSSGGAIVSDAGELIGIAVTATQETTTGERDLRAITLAHIDRALSEANKGGVHELIESAETDAETFNQFTAPTLRNILVAELQK